MATFNDNREALLEELFTGRNPVISDTSASSKKEGLKMKFLRLERLKKQELSRWWDLTILERYIQIKQIPRGLRVVLFPSFGDLNPLLLQEWEQLLISSSFGIMDILIRDAREKRDRLLVEIELLEKEIQDTNLKEGITKNYDILNKVLQQHQIYIKDKKMRKLRRDANDYATGRVFTFAHKFDNFNNDNRTNTASLPPAQPVSSITSSDTELSRCSSITSDEASCSRHDQDSLSHIKSTFLLEMERFRRGQRHNRNTQATYPREPEGEREKRAEQINNKTGVTTRSVTRNLKN
ncbi:hypothetical protein NDU88_001871 [Pleurodeles waltl]|uniref:Uncharacterized protein n=1 Tax=Pleurodeles waltl TaxID=8319 RepID=A0AAV7MTY5_PLEWA|nr:hypothetical protein NDU88_001870 [Pleurodeles waltl]KAJ1104459.1 hypothetical protein NDU88_001871 [Pleurodeles waltl]